MSQPSSNEQSNDPTNAFIEECSRYTQFHGISDETMSQPSSNEQSDDPTNAFIEKYSQYTQFHGIPDETLMRLAERKTGLEVENRWVAIALIIRNPMPIPVPEPAGAIKVQCTAPSAPAKLQLIYGGKHPAMPTPATGRKRPAMARPAVTRSDWLTEMKARFNK